MDILLHPPYSVEPSPQKHAALQNALMDIHFCKMQTRTGHRYARVKVEFGLQHRV